MTKIGLDVEYLFWYFLQLIKAISDWSKKTFNQYSFIFLNFEELYNIYRINQNKYSTFKHVHNRLADEIPGK